MQITKKTILLSLIILAFGIPILFKSYVEYELNHYAFLNYKISHLASSVDFNWKTMNYEAQIDINDHEYGLNYSFFDLQIIDDYLNLAEVEKFNKIISDWSSRLPCTIVVDGSLFINVDAFDHSNTSSMLYLNIENASKDSQSSGVEQMSTIAYDCIDFLINEYSISGVQIIYIDLTGGYTIEIPYSPWRKEITLAMLTEKAVELNLDELGEVNLKWIEENN